MTIVFERVNTHFKIHTRISYHKKRVSFEYLANLSPSNVTHSNFLVLGLTSSSDTWRSSSSCGIKSSGGNSIISSSASKSASSPQPAPSSASLGQSPPSSVCVKNTHRHSFELSPNSPQELLTGTRVSTQVCVAR